MGTIHRSQSRAFLVTITLLLSPCHLVILSPCHASDGHIDSPMYKLPELPPAPRVEVVFPDRAIELWLKALQRPEADLKCKAADAIALGYQRGMKGLEKTVGPLKATLDVPDQHSTVRQAVARTLIALDAREAAESLFHQARLGSRAMR